jgi:hypothetical protein
MICTVPSTWNSLKGGFYFYFPKKTEVGEIMGSGIVGLGSTLLFFPLELSALGQVI